MFHISVFTSTTKLHIFCWESSLHIVYTFYTTLCHAGCARRMGLQVSRVPNRVKPCAQRWLCWNCFLSEECCWCGWERWKSWACQVLPRHKLVGCWIKKKETTNWKWWVCLSMTSFPHFDTKVKPTEFLSSDWCSFLKNAYFPQTLKIDRMPVGGPWSNVYHFVVVFVMHA